MFSRIRTKAFVIATSQSTSDINTKANGLFSKKFLGRISDNDMKALIKYFYDTQFKNISHITRLNWYDPHQRMIIDGKTLRNLEVIKFKDHVCSSSSSCETNVTIVLRESFFNKY